MRFIDRFPVLDWKVNRVEVVRKNYKGIDNVYRTYCEDFFMV